MSDDLTSHYGTGGLRARIEAALAGVDAPVTVATLGALTEFHIGGRPAAIDLVDRLDLASGSRILDLGSGLGGTSRLLAERYDATVLGVDLTPEFVEVATWLTALVGLADRVEARVGNILDLGPDLDDGAFDAVTMLHVGMNIADKAALAGEIHRAVRPGGVVGIYDVMQGPADEPVDFPVPWASGPDASFVEPASVYTDGLMQAGFVVDEVEDRSTWCLELLSRAGAPRPDGLGLHLVMGADVTTKVANMVAALRGGRIAPTVIVAHRR